MGSLNSGTMCNAALLSNPNIALAISTGTILNPEKHYAIIFKDLEKVPFANNVSYSITPRRIVNADFDFSTLAYKGVDAVGEKEIVFCPERAFYVDGCY